jgi:hypothetical protein
VAGEHLFIANEPCTGCSVKKEHYRIQIIKTLTRSRKYVNRNSVAN